MRVISVSLPLLLPLMGAVGGFVCSKMQSGNLGNAVLSFPHPGANAPGITVDPAVSCNQRIGDAADFATLGVLWTALHEAPLDELTRPWLEHQLLDRMVQLDAMAGWKWAASFDPKDPHNPRNEYLAAWGAAHHLAAAAAIFAEPGKHGKDIDMIAEAWARTDPAAFLTQGPPADWKYQISYEMRVQTLSRLSETDLPKALELAKLLNQPNALVSKDLLTSFAQNMTAQRGAEGALAWAKEMTDWPESMRNQLRASVIASLALENPALAAREYLGIAAQGNSSVASVIARQLYQTDPAAALKWASSINNTWQVQSARVAAFATIARSIGPDAQALLSATSELTDAQGFAHALMSGLNPAPATMAPLLRSFAAQPSTENRDSLMTASLQILSRTDPAAAVAMLKEVGPGMSPDSVSQFLGQLAFGETSGVPAAEQMALANQFGASKRVNEQLLLKHLSQEDPVAAIQQNLASDALQQFSQLKEIFNAWTEMHPQAAADHIANLPADQHAAAIEGVVASWTKFDPMAASLWATNLSPGNDKDEAAASLANALVKDEPSSAFAWASTLPANQKLLKHTLSAWIKEDSTSARQGVEAANLPETVKAELFTLFTPAK